MRGSQLFAVMTWLVPAVFIVYVALRNGGYDTIPRGEAGLLVWWAILLAGLAGWISVARGGRAAIVVVALLAALAAWAALALGWTESTERTMIELGRLLTYLGILLLALAAAAGGQWRGLLAGVALGVGVVAALALLSRLQPSLFPESVSSAPFPELELERRLGYPLNYSSGLAALVAAGLPLWLHFAVAGRTWLGRGLAVAALPVAALTLWFTGSSLVLPLLAVGLLAYLALSDERLARVPALVLAAASGGLLMAVANGKAALDRGLATPEAMREGDDLLIVVVLVVLVVVGLHAGLERLLERRPLPSPPPLSRGAGLALAGSGLTLVVVVGLALGGAGKISDQWDKFKAPDGLGAEEAARGAQVLDVSSRGRYEYWQAAVEASGTERLTGIGPGTYEFYWAREGTGGGAIFVRDAHSLYLEMLAELGVPGLILVLAFVGSVLAVATARAWRAPPASRAALAAAAAGCWTFAAAAAVDWIWELAAVVIPFLLLAGVAVAGAGVRPEPTATGAGGATAAWLERGLLAALSVAAIVAIAIPLASETAIEQSRAAVADGRLSDALADARQAVAIEPHAATPRLQEALVLEDLGLFEPSLAAAREATRRESTNWRTWLVLSRIAARSGDAEGSVEAYLQAQRLFPRGVRAPE